MEGKSLPLHSQAVRFRTGPDVWEMGGGYNNNNNNDNNKQSQQKECLTLHPRGCHQVRVENSDAQMVASSSTSSSNAESTLD
eukprot:4632264-Amphidinium_carterae.1